jgi:hypothetical protein
MISHVAAPVSLHVSVLNFAYPPDVLASTEPGANAIRYYDTEGDAAMLLCMVL